MVPSHINVNDRLTSEMIASDKDWLLSPKAMRGYLQYRLYMIEYQIDRLMIDLGGRDAPPFPTDLNDTAFPDQSWTLWARLNYLMQARDSLQDVLSHPKRKLN
jgi:hypothetical protein